MQKDLAEAVRQLETLRHYLNARKEMSPEEAAKHAPLTDVEANCAAFISTHHAEIAQNAETVVTLSDALSKHVNKVIELQEAAKRLAALERAMEDFANGKVGPCYPVKMIRERANEIMRAERRTPEKAE